MAKMGKMVATVGLVAAVAAALSGCAMEDAPDEVGVCIDPKTEMRLDDDKCDRDGNDREGSVWFFYNTSHGHSSPPVGQKVNRSHGTMKPTTTSFTRGGVPTTGSVISKSAISRGGFGTGVSGTKGGS